MVHLNRRNPFVRIQITMTPWRFEVFVYYFEMYCICEIWQEKWHSQIKFNAHITWWTVSVMTGGEAGAQVNGRCTWDTSVVLWNSTPLKSGPDGKFVAEKSSTSGFYIFTRKGSMIVTLLTFSTLDLWLRLN